MSDPYSILGVTPNSSEAEIKSAYRKLAMQYHPDRNPGDTVAEDKFKEIQNAYDQVKDGKKPSPQHDMFGGFDFNFGFNGHPMEEVLRSWSFQQSTRNRHYNTICQISLENAFYGCEVSLNINGKNLNITVPPGVDNGSRLKVAGEGENVHPQSPAGDLFVNIEILHSEKFARDGKHLFIKQKIGAFDAILGFNLEITNIDDEVISVDIPPGTQDGSHYRIEGKGMPVVGKPERGDLYIVAEIVIPTDLSEKQLMLLREVKAA